jgi:enoyl-CoA hydratase
MPYSTLLFDLADGIATITVNRPDKLNALNAAVIAELDDAAGRVTAEPGIRAAILTGAGSKAFVAGADIGEIGGQGAQQGQARALAGQRMMRRLERCGKPVVAAVNGFALGGGCELAMACHLRIASDSARFGQPEVKLGIIPGYGGTLRLPRIVGKGRALELILTGEMIDAAEAHRIGLVNRVVPQDELLGAARSLMQTILKNGPVALALAIECTTRGLEMDLDDGLALESNLFGLLAATVDMREGMGAFLEKRRAEFSGR